MYIVLMPQTPLLEVGDTFEVLAYNAYRHPTVFRP